MSEVAEEGVSKGESKMVRKRNLYFALMHQTSSWILNSLSHVAPFYVLF